MAGVNKAIIIGNLGDEPKIHQGNNGALATLSIATSDSWTDKNTQEKKEKTEWHRVVAFGKLAEIMGKYLHKGSKVYIEGKIQTRKWADEQGNDKYTTEIVARDMQMLDAKGSQGGGGNQAPQQQQAQPAQQPATDFGNFDDDIPF